MDKERIQNDLGPADLAIGIVLAAMTIGLIIWLA